MANDELIKETIGQQFLEIRRVINELRALPEGEANLGIDKVNELHEHLADINEQMSDLGITVHLTPVEIEASALAILTKLVSRLFLITGGCEECPYSKRCYALGFEYNDETCALRLFLWFSKADFPWLYPDSDSRKNSGYFTLEVAPDDLVTTGDPFGIGSDGESTAGQASEGAESDPTPIEYQGPGHEPHKRGGPMPPDERKRY